MTHTADSIPRSLIALESLAHVSPDRLARAVMACGLPYAEATRASRRQRGVLFRRLDSVLAETLAGLLRDDGVDVAAHDEGAFPDFARVTSLESIRADDLGLTAPAMVAIGRGGFMAWEDVALVSVGVWEGEEAHSLRGVEQTLLSGVTTHEDHQVMAAKSFEVMTRRAFDLSPYLDTSPEDAVNFSRISAGGVKSDKRRGGLLRGKSRSSPSMSSSNSRSSSSYSSRVSAPAPPRYTVGNPALEARLLVSDGVNAWSLNAHTAAMVTDGERAGGHWMRGLHALASRAVERATGAFRSPELRAFVARSEAAKYVVEDWESFEDGCRWWLAQLVREGHVARRHPGAVSEGVSNAS